MDKKSSRGKHSSKSDNGSSVQITDLPDDVLRRILLDDNKMSRIKNIRAVNKQFAETIHEKDLYMHYPTVEALVKRVPEHYEGSKDSKEFMALKRGFQHGWLDPNMRSPDGKSLLILEPLLYGSVDVALLFLDAGLDSTLVVHLPEGALTSGPYPRHLYSNTKAGSYSIFHIALVQCIKCSPRSIVRQLWSEFLTKSLDKKPEWGAFKVPKNLVINMINAEFSIGLIERFLEAGMSIKNARGSDKSLQSFLDDLIEEDRYFIKYKNLFESWEEKQTGGHSKQGRSVKKRTYRVKS